MLNYKKRKEIDKNINKFHRFLRKKNISLGLKFDVKFEEDSKAS